MPRLKTDLLKEGMVVAREVKNLDDMLLLPAGCTLSERHINILQAWGVREVEVEATAGVEEPGDPLAQLPPEVLAQWTAEMKAMFWKLDESNPVAMEVFQLMLERKARRAANR